MARSAKGKKDKGLILVPRDASDVDRNILVTETEVDRRMLTLVPEVLFFLFFERRSREAAICERRSRDIEAQRAEEKIKPLGPGYRMLRGCGRYEINRCS